MTRPAVLDQDVVVGPREANADMWTAAAVPLERWRTEPFFASKNDAAVLSYRAALSASPHASAWAEVRKYVEGLERERDDLRLSSKNSADWANQAITDMKAAEARCAVLENQNGSLRHEVMVARLSHEQLNRYISAFDGIGYKGNNIEVQVKMAVEEVKSLRSRLSRSQMDGDIEASEAKVTDLLSGILRADETVKEYEARVSQLDKDKHAALTMIAMLEKRLADAERVIEPFARVWDMSRDSTTVGVNNNLCRAARAYMEGK